MSSNGQTIRAGVWDLDVTDHDVAAESILLNPNNVNLKDPESVFDPDRRKRVSKADYGPGGKYRSIVKIRIRYEKQDDTDERWAMGTGWLISSDVMVTAGHCVYDWREPFGRAVHINAYIGYNGKASVDSPNVQSRRAKRALTTEGWLQSYSNRINDVAFVKLEKPFVGVEPFSFDATPSRGEESLGVVGYPGDKFDNETEEKGPFMYEEYANVKYDLDTSEGHMLQYKVSTFAGQSGSPVLRQGSNNSIGTHVYGGSGPNSASVIGGQYGNPYDVYIKALNTDIQPSNQEVKYVEADVSTQKTTGEEGFMDVLKKIMNIGGPIAGEMLTVGTPFLGPAGLPVAALASVALAAAGKLCHAESSAESSIPPNLERHGFSERAILAQAALETVLHMDGEVAERNQIQEKMEETYKALAPNATRVAPKILTPLIDQALRITLDSMQKSPRGVLATISSGRKDVRGAESSDGTLGEPGVETFKKGLLVPTCVVGGEEGFFDNIGDTIQKGLRIGRSALKTAHQGLGVLIDVLPESAMDEDSTAHALDTAAKRAVMGEAALQAVMTVDRTELEAEGFFDKMKETMQRIGTQVLKSAPQVIKAVTPIVRGLLQENKASWTQKPQDTPSLQPPKPKISKKPSFADVLGKKAGASPLPMQDQLPIFRIRANKGTDELELVQRPLMFSGGNDSNEDLPPFQ